MNYLEKTKWSDMVEAIANVGVSAYKTKDAQGLLSHIIEEFFCRYDPADAQHKYYILHYFEEFASYARILRVCLDDIANDLNAADDVLCNVSAADFQAEVSDGDENG